MESFQRLLLIICSMLPCVLAEEGLVSVSISPFPLRNSSFLPSLDIALEYSQTLPLVFLKLTISNESFAVISVATVWTEVVIEGEDQRVVIAGKIEIVEDAVLNVTRTEFRDSGNSGAVFEVRGKLWIEDCDFYDFGRSIFSVLGEIQVRTSNILRSTEVGFEVNSEEGVLILYQVNVTRHLGTVLAIVSNSRRFAQVKVQISECVFQNAIMRNQESLFDIETKTSGGDFNVTDSLFSNNNSPLFYFDVIELTVRFVSSEFIFNDRTVFTVYALDSTFEMENMTARHNADILLDIYQFRGDFSILNSSISEQQRMGPIRLYNSLSAADCHFSMLNSRFFDIKVISDRETPGALTITSCMAHVTDLSIRNVTIAGMGMRDVRGLLYIEQGQMTIERVYTEDSGTAGAFLFSLYGDMTVKNCYFNNPFSYERIYIILTFGTLRISNLTVLNGGILDWNQAFMGSNSPIYIILVSGAAEIQAFTAFRTNHFARSDIVFAFGYSRFNMSFIHLENIEMGAILALSASSGFISDIALQQCIIGIFGVQLLRQSVLEIRNFSIETASSWITPRGVISLTSNSTLSAYNLYFTNLSLSIVITAKSSSASFENVTVTHSKIDYFIYYPLKSTITIRNLNFSRSLGGVVYATESSISFLGGTIDSVVSKRHLIGGVLADIRLSGITIRKVKTSWQIVKMDQGSYLAISDSHIGEINSDTGEGIRMLDGTLIITHSSFTFFRVSLIQAKTSSVTLEDSVFRDGKSQIQSLKSKLAFGGVLYCEDCDNVSILKTTFFNVTARWGGAVTVKKQKTEGMAFFLIRNSSFFLCNAYVGGALLIQNATFIIEASVFTSNSAQKTGGAIDVSIPSSNSGLIENCTFTRNSALEGGAVKWHNAEITFVRATFIENNATYGADIGSYGMRIALTAANLTETQASGFPLSFAFELLDHYRHRVTTATNKAFQLIPSSTVSFRGNEVSIISEGVFRFSELTVYAPPNSSQVISGVMEDTQGDFKLSLRGEVKIAFRDCIFGEIRRTDRCEYCYSGNVSYSIYDENCRFCPIHSLCTGGSVLLVDSHYWRNAWNSTTILKCPLEDKCLGGENSTCSEGFTGLLCNQCASGFYRFRMIECENCGNQAVLWVQMAMPILLMSIFAYKVLRYSGRKSNPVKLFAIKTFVHHAQFLSAMSSLKVSFPDIVKNSLHGITYVSSLLITDLPLACFGFSAPEYVRALIGSLLLPILIPIFALACRVCTKSWKSNTIILVTSSMLFTPVVAANVLIPLLACQKIDSEEEWLFLDMTQQCWTNSHLRIVYPLLIPSLILNFVLPVWTATLFAFTRPRLFSTYFPMWVSGYEWRCWDSLLLISKSLCFSVLIVSRASDKLIQLLYGLIVMIVTCLVNVSVVSKIFVNDRYFRLSESSLLVTIISLSLGGCYIYYEPTGTSRDYVISAVFLFLNLSLLAACLIVKFVPDRRASQSESVESLQIGGQVNPAVPNNSMSESRVEVSHSLYSIAEIGSKS